MEELFADLENRMEPYDGGDPNTSSTNSCSACYEREPEVNLRRCSRCHVVYYCSVACQKDDLSQHKESCKMVKKLTEELEEERVNLGQVEPMFGETPLNYFEDHVGDFWSMIETRDYCRKREHLSRELYHLVYWIETVEAWEAVLGHQLELLRLIRRDNMGIRSKVPFVLLYLNRDDDCMDFIRFWYRDSGGEMDGEEMAESSPGDWLYGRTPNGRLMDIFALHPTIDPSYTDLAFLVAILIIKLRVVAAFDAREKSFALFENTKVGKSLNKDVLGAIRAAVIGDLKVKAEQNRQIEHVINLIQQSNETMLPSLINPGPLKLQPSPYYYSHGTPSEAYGVLMDSNRCFVRVPGAEKRIETIYGPKPQYDCDMKII